MNTMHAQEFVRRLKKLMEDTDSRFAFFLGSGCSVSSEIPAAAQLVKQWLPKLKELRTGNQGGLDEWIKKEFSDYHSDVAAIYYGRVIEDLFLTSEERQKEIERLTEGKDPGFGYAVLAQLISHEAYGRHCNIALTTNFDDMVADALYLYTNKKPLVISHESLVNFVRITRTRPLVVKLHGDARLAPKNTELETEKLAESVKKVLNSLLSEIGIIFIGYGGNDKSIVTILKELHEDALPGGVWWVGDKLPDNEMAVWLKGRNAKWVNHKDFDELMLLIWSEFGLKHPDKGRFDKLLNTYSETFEKLKNKVEAQPDTEESTPLKTAVDKAVEEAKGSWSVILEARKYKETNPGKADSIYKKGIELYPNDAKLLGYYAYFLEDVLKNHEAAENYYRKSLEINPDDYLFLGFYADFLNSYRGDYDQAEEFHKRAIEANSYNNYNLTAYAVFLANVRNDYDKAEEYFLRAIEVDPTYGYALKRYAEFIVNIRNDYDKAEEYFRRNIGANPNYAFGLTGYAEFLKDVRHDYDNAEKYYLKAVETNPNEFFALDDYAEFLRDIRHDNDKAEEYFKKAQEIKEKKQKLVPAAS